METVLLFTALAAAQYADVATTKYILNRGGEELNSNVIKIMQRFGEKWGEVKIAAIMAIAAALFLGCYLWYGTVTAGNTVLMLMCVVSALPVVWNINVIRKMRNAGK